jgi:hypothetical protein
MFRIPVSLVFISICLTSCQKLIDYYNVNEVVEPPACAIVKISGPNAGGVEVKFYYNSAGLPDSAVEGPYGEYPFQTLYPYEYDGLGRLIRSGAYTTESPSKVTYAYEGSSRLPARDTIHSFTTTVQYLDYDANGRVVRVYSKVLDDQGEVPIPDTEIRYYYDIRGNRQEHPSNENYAGLIAYSDKPNVYSLNKVWQLIYKNYSVNSLSIGATFNEHGLPLTIKEDTDFWNYPFYNITQGRNFTYGCR